MTICGKSCGKTMKLHRQTYWYPERPKLIHPDQLGDYEGSTWIGEPKYDDRRLELHRWEKTWIWWNRHHELMAYEPNQELEDALNRLNLSGYWVFDGGLRHNKVPGVRHKAVLWDIFVAEGRLLLGMPYKDRRAILHSLAIPTDNGGPLITPPTIRKGFAQAFESYLPDKEIEGLVLKNLEGKLNLGRTRAIDSTWMRKARKPSGRYAF